MNRHSIVLLWGSLFVSAAAGFVVSLRVGSAGGVGTGLLLLGILWGCLGPLSLLSAVGAEDSSRALERVRARRRSIRSHRIDRRRGQLSVLGDGADRGYVSTTPCGSPGRGGGSLFE